MTGPSHPDSRGRIGPFALHASIIVLCVAIGAILSLTRGQDICFDQLNYHYYAAYAYMTDRLGQDVAPAQVAHSYLSPLIYLPFYVMVRHLPPQAVGMLLGALHGLNLWLVFIIARIVTRSVPPTARAFTVLACVAISAFSPMAISEFGTSMTDIVISLPVLAGLALLMNAEFRPGRTGMGVLGIAGAGALLGAATSLKLTGASFAVGLAVASLVGWSTWRHRLLAMFSTALGGGIGFAVVGGSWYLTMWRLFGNPVFPYFNTLFHSPDFPAKEPLFDDRFLPHGIGEALIYPFRWIHAQTTTAEIAFRDVRFAALIILGMIAVAALFRPGRRSSAPAPPGRRLIVFMIVAFGVWMYLWSIQRYLISLELLVGPAFIVIAQWILASEGDRRHLLPVGAVAFAAICGVTLHAPNWAHLGWRQTWYAVETPPLGGPTPLIVLAGEPLSWVVPELPPGATTIGIVRWDNYGEWQDSIFLRRIRALVADPRNTPVWAVSSGPWFDGFEKQIAVYGLKPAGSCVSFRGRPLPLTWCPLARAS